MPFCAACGAGVSTQVCLACGTPLAPAAADDAPRDLFLQRTPFQLAILTFTTCGLYPWYWLVRARRLAERRLGRNVTSLWFFLTMLIPIYGIIVIFESYSTAQRRVAAAGVRPALPFWVCALGLGLVGILWRLPGSYVVLSFLDGIWVLPAYAAYARAERLEAPTLRWARFTVAEWILTMAGGTFMLLVFLGSLIGVSLAERLTVLGVAAAWACAAGASWAVSRRMRALPAERP